MTSRGRGCSIPLQRVRFFFEPFRFRPSRAAVSFAAAPGSGRLHPDGRLSARQRQLLPPSEVEVLAVVAAMPQARIFLSERSRQPYNQSYFYPHQE